MTEPISVLEVFHGLSGGEVGLDDTQLLILAVSLSVHSVLNKVYSFTSLSVNLFQDKSRTYRPGAPGALGGSAPSKGELAVKRPPDMAIPLKADMEPAQSVPTMKGAQR